MAVEDGGLFRGGEVDPSVAFRLRQLGDLTLRGVDAYPSEFPQRTHTAKEIHENIDDLAGVPVVIAGRIVDVRDHKRSTFYDVRDATGEIQATLDADIVSPDIFETTKAIFSRGDVAAISGAVGRTKKGATSVNADSMVLLAKALASPPDRLEIPDARFSKRYLDFLVNAASRERLLARSKVTQHIRQTLTDRGMIEVESPILNTFYNGGVAKPFVSKHNALDSEVFMRVTSELYLKKLIIGGFEGVFEIAKQFRNEGMGPIYSPEFSVLEMYQAYQSHEWMMDAVEDIIRGAAQKVNGGPATSWRGHEIDLSGPWPRISMRNAVSQSLGATAPLTDSELLQVGQRDGIEGDADKILAGLFRRYTEPTLVQPTFITEFPVSLSPMAKMDTQHEGTVQKFMCYVGGTLISDGNYEENDPRRQAQNFESQLQQLRTDGIPDYPRDPDFLNALQYGMPPLAGAAIGIDRLAMLLTGSNHIREVIAFQPRKRGES